MNKLKGGGRGGRGGQKNWNCHPLRNLWTCPSNLKFIIPPLSLPPSPTKKKILPGRCYLALPISHQNTEMPYKKKKNNKFLLFLGKHPKTLQIKYYFQRLRFLSCTCVCVLLLVLRGRCTYEYTYIDCPFLPDKSRQPDLGCYPKRAPIFRVKHPKPKYQKKKI